MDNNPPRPPEALPKSKELEEKSATRGSKAGKSARREREAWQRWIFAQEEGSARFADPESVPFKRPDGTYKAKLRTPAASSQAVVSR